MNYTFAPEHVLVVIGFIALGLIVIYLIVRLTSAALYRSRVEAEAERAALMAEWAESQKRKEK